MRGEKETEGGERERERERDGERKRKRKRKREREGWGRERGLMSGRCQSMVVRMLSGEEGNRVCVCV